MYRKIKNIFFLTIFLVFAFLITKYYFSEQNVIFINKTRSSYVVTTKNEIYNLPLLKNDTNNVIIYLDDLKEFENKRKKRIWEKLISNKKDE